MKPPVPGWVPIISREPVVIPNSTGDGIAETIYKDVPAWQDPTTGEIYLDGEAHEILDGVKARYMGILLPSQLRDLRNAIGTTQRGMAELLQLGEKSWTRWETGAERPSRSMNLLLCSVYDGKVDVNYLRSMADPAMRSQFRRWTPAVKLETLSYMDTEPYKGWTNAGNALAA